MFSSAGVTWMFYPHLCNRSTFFFLLQNFTLFGIPLLVPSLPMKSRKSLLHDVIDTCAMHASLVHYIKDWLPGTNWQGLHLWVFFCDLSKNNIWQTRPQSKLKTAASQFFCSIPINRAYNPSSEVQNTQEVRKTLFDWMKRDKMCNFF